jgi:hypothetical protein
LGVSLDVAPTKLTQGMHLGVFWGFFLMVDALSTGSGDAVCVVLNALTDCALRAVRFSFQRPVRQEESVFLGSFSVVCF